MSSPALLGLGDIEPVYRGRDNRRLNEAHAERVRVRRRFGQEGEAAS